MADGLYYLHTQGWIHRDVKPENYLVSPEGDVKLIDFALAQKQKGSLARMLSGKGKIQGTRSYMSPEQIRGKPLDPRADVYSFGCSIHELVGGKPPFTGSDTNELLMKHLRTPAPPLVVIDKNVTSEFSGLVQRLLSKKPDDRPESMEMFLREFRKIRVFKEMPKELSK
jgi:serine/threonine protein kinase